MRLDNDAIIRLSERIEVAQTYAFPLRKLTDDYPEMTVADAYRVQLALRDSYVRRGQRVVGWKAGLTSKPKMDQMGVDKPGVGFLTDAMARPENSLIALADMIHPRAECEIAFVTGIDLRGQVSTEDVLAATEFIQPAIEIIDSRFTGFKFDLESVLCDNSSSARFIVGGRPRRPREVDMRTLGTVIEKNGEIVEFGAAANVMGHPARAVAMLVGILSEFDESLPAGSIVLSGAITAAIPVSAGDCVTARFLDMGSVSIRFGD